MQRNAQRIFNLSAKYENALGINIEIHKYFQLVQIRVISYYYRF